MNNRIEEFRYEDYLTNNVYQYIEEFITICNEVHYKEYTERMEFLIRIIRQYNKDEKRAFAIGVFESIFKKRFNKKTFRIAIRDLLKIGIELDIFLLPDPTIRTIIRHLSEVDNLTRRDRHFMYYQKYCEYTYKWLPIVKDEIEKTYTQLNLLPEAVVNRRISSFILGSPRMGFGRVRRSKSNKGKSR